MSYELSFSPEFFLAEGEPYDTDGPTLKRGKPVSVWSAILVYPKKEWRAMAKEVFGLDGKQAKLLMAEAVLEKVQETNTCSNLDSPVSVWIDPDGKYTLEVY